MREKEDERKSHLADENGTVSVYIFKTFFDSHESVYLSTVIDTREDAMEMARIMLTLFVAQQI
jgi:hypothetical protein